MSIDEIIEIAARELEQAIVQTAAEDGLDLDDPKLAIFPEQRVRYRRQMAAVLAVVVPIIQQEEREAFAKMLGELAHRLRMGPDK